MFILDTSTSDSILKKNVEFGHIHVQGNKLPCIPSNYLFDASRREVQCKLRFKNNHIWVRLLCERALVSTITLIW